ncbi:hypothetical protein ACLSU7_00180 [Bdellovibrio sp. HCB185ZH]|uniref:hypothetical protein n=1 Tax=Bdellovibrio sp. HCB185ZH TaxID=3394235 RepID=UPI0039A583A8
MGSLLILLLLPFTSIASADDITLEQATKLVFPKLNPKSFETHRNNNELLSDEGALANIVSKSGHALAVFRIRNGVPTPSGMVIEDQFADHHIEVYLLKSKPHLAIEAKGVFNQRQFCDCESDDVHVHFKPSNATMPITTKDDAYIIETQHPYGGTNFSYDDTFLNAFKQENHKLIQILNVATETSMAFRCPDRSEDCDGPLDYHSKFKIKPTSSFWLLDGYDNNFIYGQNLPIKRVFQWDRRNKIMKENRNAGTKCSSQIIKQASIFAKEKEKEGDFVSPTTTIENVIEQCANYDTFSKFRWLESDLIFYYFKSAYFDSCLSLAKKLEGRKDFSSRPKKVQEAILHNKKLCTGKTKTPAL